MKKNAFKAIFLDYENYRAVLDNDYINREEIGSNYSDDIILNNNFAEYVIQSNLKTFFRKNYSFQDFFFNLKEILVSKIEDRYNNDKYLCEDSVNIFGSIVKQAYKLKLYDISPLWFSPYKLDEEEKELSCLLWDLHWKDAAEMLLGAKKHHRISGDRAYYFKENLKYFRILFFQEPKLWYPKDSYFEKFWLKIL